MIEVKLAVGVGYEFAIINSDEVHGISLKNTHSLVSVNDEVYPLYKGETFNDSKKIDEIMDKPNHPQIYKIDKHLIR